ncbi:DUF1134 domain-containing protein [Microvirga sp. W0021]|uniref:DUF1134 domain-containing protein n=1 Tax=Hohaiivirga grylli TaxID=3133970 RepID=A0ABV0BID6_9HYPH
MRITKFLIALGFSLVFGLSSLTASAQQKSRNQDTFEPHEIVGAGHRFFGQVSRGLAMAVQDVTKKWGKPNAYILGQEASGAFFAGLRFGEGTIYTKSGTQRYVFWQGPSLGFDAGGEGARTMMLVYNLSNVDTLYQRFAGIDGSAYFIGGFGVTAVRAGDTVIVPIRSGVGARLGVNLGYLKFTRSSTWNPF